MLQKTRCFFRFFNTKHLVTAVNNFLLNNCYHFCMIESVFNKKKKENNIRLKILKHEKILNVIFLYLNLSFFN